VIRLSVDANSVSFPVPIVVAAFARTRILRQQKEAVNRERKFFGVLGAACWVLRVWVLGLRRS
jgi:hypothetical protein